MIFVVSIYLSVDFFEKIDDFIEKGLPFSKAIIFFLYKTPFIIAQILPVSVLLSVIIVFGLMTRNREIIALKSSGFSLYTMAKPVVLMGFVFGVVLFIFSEAIVPIATERANQIWLREVRGESAVISREKDVWLKENRSIIHINHYDPSRQVVYGLSVYDFDADFRMKKRCDAQRAEYLPDKKQWQMFGLMEQTRAPDRESYTVKFYESQFIDIGLVPEDLTRVVKKSEAMGFSELRSYIHRIESEGYSSTSYKVDLYGKTAFPFICVIMSLMGTGLSMRRRIGENMAIGITSGIGIAFLYWVSYTFCLSLGYGEMLPPVIAAWTANLIFTAMGILLLLYAE